MMDAKKEVLEEIMGMMDGAMVAPFAPKKAEAEMMEGASLDGQAPAEIAEGGSPMMDPASDMSEEDARILAELYGNQEDDEDDMLPTMA